MSFITFLNSAVGKKALDSTYCLFLRQIGDEAKRIAGALESAFTISPSFAGRIVKEHELVVARLRPAEHRFVLLIKCVSFVSSTSQSLAVPISTPRRIYAFLIGPNKPSLIIQAEIFHGNATLALSLGPDPPSSTRGDFLREMSKEGGTKSKIVVAPHDPRLHSGVAYVGIWAGDQCTVPGGSRIHLSVRKSLPHSLRLGHHSQDEEKHTAIIKMRRTETAYLCLDPPTNSEASLWMFESGQ